MPDVLIVAEPSPSDGNSASLRLVTAMKQAILADSSRAQEYAIEVVPANQLEPTLKSGRFRVEDLVLCPLTLELPELPLAIVELHQRCRDWANLRQRVAAWNYLPGPGDRWLPIVLTRKGALYGEAIGRSQDNSGCALHYIQPLHLSDRWRQPLYSLGHRLLKSLDALPGVYLLQFGIADEGLQFDRLLPFPDLPAIASQQVQNPDLFTCHWRCLTGQPIYDLLIA